MDWTVLAYEKSSFPRKKKKRIVSVSNHLTIWSVSSFGENTVRKSGSAYPIQLPKKKKGNVWFQKFDYSSTFDRRVSEKFPTKGKNHQKQSESVSFWIRKFELTQSFDYSSTLFTKVSNDYPLTKFYQRRSVTFKSFHHSSIFDESDRECRIASIRKSIDSRNCVSSYRKICVSKKKKEGNLHWNTWIIISKKHLKFFLKLRFISLPATRVYPVHPGDRYLGTGAHGGSILTYFPVWPWIAEDAAAGRGRRRWKKDEWRWR